MECHPSNLVDHQWHLSCLLVHDKWNLDSCLHSLLDRWWKYLQLCCCLSVFVLQLHLQLMAQWLCDPLSTTRHGFRSYWQQLYYSLQWLHPTQIPTRGILLFSSLGVRLLPDRSYDWRHILSFQQIRALQSENLPRCLARLLGCRLVQRLYFTWLCLVLTIHRSKHGTWWSLYLIDTSLLYRRLYWSPNY
jgi:hypothetical protein